MSSSIAVIFGGTGFIGVFFAKFILDNNLMNKVYLVDIQPADSKSSAFLKKQINNDPRMVFVSGDVRNSLDWFSPPESVSLIANFAAVHREPGHQEKEYYETNLLGAENVCAWAEKMHCNRILFTSSISPYGVGDSVKDESLLPVPTTAYGGSKLVAEKIHQIWQAKEKHERKLVIVRP